MAAAEDLLKQALAFHQAGRLPEAQELYERMLERDPAHAEALYLLGTVAGQRGDWPRSADLIRRAIQVHPAEARYYNNLGIALKRQGLVDDAVQAYRDALARQADSPEALSNLGNLLGLKGRWEEAAAFCRRAVELRPAYAEAHYNLGLALEALDKPGEARAAHEKAAALQPRFAEAHYHLGLLCRNHGDLAKALACFQAALRARPGMPAALLDAGVVLEKLGRTADAETTYREAIHANPNNAPAQNNLGNLLRARGESQQAVNCYRRALAAAPDFPEAWYNLASALATDAETRNDALAAFEKAIALRPGYLEAHNNLGALLRQMGRHEEALAIFEKGRALAPDHVSLLNNFGETLFALQRFDEAIAVFRRALLSAPTNAEVLNNLAAALNMTGDLDAAVASSEAAVAADPHHAAAWCNLGNGLRARGETDPALAAIRRAMELKPDPVWHSNLLYMLHFHPDSTPESLLQEHRAWNRLHAAKFAADIRPHDIDPQKDRRLRIGYVSPDFRNHPVGRFMAVPLEHHDRDRVEVFCYSDVIVPDALTARIRAAAQAWRDIQGMPDDQVARMIRRDRIDILVDLTMHMNRNRLLVFARKPAPVQATYLAYCSTTGLETMDYRLTDPHIDPPGTDAFYTEKSWRLPASYWCYEAPAEAPDVNDPPALANGFVTFGCLNHFSKVSPEVLGAWRELLASLPNSRLILHAHPGQHRERALAFLVERGIGQERIGFVALQGMLSYLATYGRIDVGLDSFPYAGGTTTCDALWMGVPVVTLRGRTAVGRGGASLLTCLELPDLVAATSDGYVEIAAGLGRDMERLRALRMGMRERMRRSAVMDALGLAKGLEEGFGGMWERYRGETGWAKSST